MKFKVGDKAKGIGGGWDVYEYLTITFAENGVYNLTKHKNGDSTVDNGRTCGSEQYWELISTNQGGEMDLVKSFNSLFLKEPEKTYREVGISDGDNMPTPEGVKIIEAYWLSQQGTDSDFYKQVALPMLEKMKEEKK